MSSQPPGEPPKDFKYWQPIVGPVSVNAMNVASCPKEESALALAFFGHSDGDRALGRPRLPTAFDFWAEYWGKLGAEGEGPFGPGGPGDPWGGRWMARVFAALPPDQIKNRLEREIEALQAIVKNMTTKKQR